MKEKEDPGGLLKPILLIIHLKTMRLSPRDTVNEDKEDKMDSRNIRKKNLWLELLLSVGQKHPAER